MTIFSDAEDLPKVDGVDLLIPNHASYLVAANAHQIANTGSSLLDPATWGETATHAGQFTVSMLTRAVASTYNAGISVGSMVGLTDDSDKAKTEDWLSSMDDDLSKYYKANQSAVDTWGDVVASLAPGLGGVKVLNWAQKGIALATKGKAGLSLAYNFGTLPNNIDKFAKLAAAEMHNPNNPFTLISANLAKSLGSSLAQNYLEVAAFTVASETTMQDSPLFKDHDMGDIVSNALTAGGFVGGGILGAASIARTVSSIKLASKATDAALNASKIVNTEPVLGTPKSEALSIHLSNRDILRSASGDIAESDELAAHKIRALGNTQLQELNNGRNAMHSLAGTDAVLGNHGFSFLATQAPEEVANKMAGVVAVARGGLDMAEAIPANIAAAEAKAAKSSALISSLERKAKKAVWGTTDHTALQARLEKATTDHADNITELKSLYEQPIAVDYLKLTGKDAGTVYSTAPTLRLADKTKDEAELLATVTKFKHVQDDTSYDIAAKLATDGEDGIEARYIIAQTKDFDLSKPVGARDMPFLERAYRELQVKSDKSLTVTLSDGQVLREGDLFRHLEEVKVRTLEDLNTVTMMNPKPLSQATLAKLVNVSDDWVVGSHNTYQPHTDLFRMQSDAVEFTQSQIDQGLWHQNKGVIPIWNKPSIMKCARDTSKAQTLTGQQISGIVALRQEQVVYQEAATRVFANYAVDFAAKYPDKIPVEVLKTANRISVGKGLATGMNGDYKTLASFVQQMGATTNEWKTKVTKDLADAFTASGSKILNDPEASTEFWKTIQQLRMTPERYRLVQNYVGDDYTGAHLVNAKHLDWKAAGSDSSKLPEFEDRAAPIAIPLKTEGVAGWAKEWDTGRKAEQSHRAAVLAGQGIEMHPALMTNFHVPGVDPNRFNHYAFVVDGAITGTGHVSMIHAASAQELEALAAKVPTEQGYKVIYKKQSEDFHKASKDYDYDLGINENYIDSALRRTGAAAPFQPMTDSKVLWEEVMRWRTNQATGLVNQMLEHKYSAEFSELRRQGELYDLAESSTKGWKGDALVKYTSNPYTDYISTALYQDTSGTAPIWDAINRLAETSVSAGMSKLQDTWKKAISEQDLEQVNLHLESIGCKAYTDAATYALANHTAPKPVLSSWVRNMNGILTTLMLRVDPMNAVTNGLGHSVLYGTELPELLKSLGEGAKLRVPGTTSDIISPAKLAAKAYGDLFAGRESAIYREAKALNLLPSYADQFAQVMEAATLKGTESVGELQGRLKVAFAATKDMMEKTGNTLEKLSGNRFAEEMNRFVSAATAIRACDAAIAMGKLDPALKSSIVNTFVNRVEGITLAKQRPLVFRGPVGQAVGLFQTYQFNMLQQLFRHVGEGNTKATATLLGLQGSIFGLNGLPAFNAMNQYLVGNASGNIHHGDMVTATYDAAGKEAGDWLLYGGASNMLLHPDAKVNLYSRGDINPRQVTVIPTNIADVPIVGATGKFFGAMFDTVSQMDKGADKWNSFLQGVQHAGISRPLSGIAQVIAGMGSPNGQVVATDAGNNIVAQNDLFTAMTAARILGAKPLDEAIALDAFHRVSTYDAADRKRLESLGAGIKATTLGGGTVSSEQYAGFASEYAKVGGKQNNFSKYLARQVLESNKSKVNAQIDNANNPHSQYLQKVMGGYDMADFINSQPKEQLGQE
jgi:hypothetical protein